MALTATEKQTLWIRTPKEYNKQFIEAQGVNETLNLVVPAFSRIVNRNEIDLSATDKKIASIDRQKRTLVTGSIPLLETGSTANSSTVSVSFLKYRDVFGLNPSESNWNALQDRVQISYDEYLGLATAALNGVIPAKTNMRLEYVEAMTMFNSLLNVREDTAKYCNDSLFNAPITNTGWSGLVIPTLGTFQASRSTLEIPAANVPYAINSIKDAMSRLGCIGNITIIASTGVMARLAPLAYQGTSNATNTSFQFDNGVRIITNAFIDDNFTTLFSSYAGNGFLVVSDNAMGVTSFAEQCCIEGQEEDGHKLSALIDPFMPDFELNIKSKTSMVAEPHGVGDFNASFGVNANVQMWTVLGKVQPRYTSAGITGILRCAIV